MANLEFIVWVKWDKFFERYEAFASEGRAMKECKEISKQCGVESFVAHYSVKNPFSVGG